MSPAHTRAHHFDGAISGSGGGCGRCEFCCTCSRRVVRYVSKYLCEIYQAKVHVDGLLIKP